MCSSLFLPHSSLGLPSSCWFLPCSPLLLACFSLVLSLFFAVPSQLFFPTSPVLLPCFFLLFPSSSLFLPVPSRLVLGHSPIWLFPSSSRLLPPCFSPLPWQGGGDTKTGPPPAEKPEHDWISLIGARRQSRWPVPLLSLRPTATGGAPSSADSTVRRQRGARHR